MPRLIDADALIKDIDGDLLDGIAEARAIEKIENAPTVSGWISVKDRLPEENKAVNIVWVNHRPESYYHGIKDRPFVSTAVYFRGLWYWWDVTLEDIIAEYGKAGYAEMDEAIEVTHWQNLPEPPKEEE